MRARHSLVLLGATMLAGCVAGPDYHRPETPLPDHYTQSPTRHAGSGAVQDLDTWWLQFDDPMLARYVSLAIAQNLDLAQAAARVTQARAGLGAANAALLPSASVRGLAARSHQSLETPLGQVASSTPDYDRWGNQYEANLEASWEIDMFGGLRRGREAAIAGLQASDAAAAATQLAVAAQTADTYIAIRGLQARLEIAQRQVRTQQELVAKVALLHERGLAAEYQVRQADGALSQVEATIPVLQSGLDAAMNALDVVLGAVPGTHRTELAAHAPIPAVPRIENMGSPANLLQRRPDLIAAERRLAAANARIGEAVSEFYPKFSLSGLLGSATNVSSGNLFSAGASQSAGVLGLRWRLFDFGRINAQIEVAKGQEAEALAAYRLAVLQATEDVENAFSALVHRAEQSVVLTRGEDALTHARASSFAAYKRGAASLLDVLYADTSLLQASDARAQAQVEAARAAVAAYKALGGGWRPDAPAQIAKR